MAEACAAVTNQTPRGDKISWRAGRDFNEELIVPWKMGLALSWERVFTDEIPQKLKRFSKGVEELLAALESQVANREQLKVLRHTSLGLFVQQLKLHMRAVADWPLAVQAVIAERQREATRLMRPFIKDKMSPAYEACTAESGTCLAPPRESTC